MRGEKAESSPDEAGPIITFDHATLRIRDRQILQGTCWEIRRGQHWVVMGPNGSGKTTLMRALIGEIFAVRGRIIRHTQAAKPRNTGYVSFDLTRRLMHQEGDRNAARDFAGDIHSVTRAKEILLAAFPDPQPKALEKVERIAAQLGMDHLLNRGISHLSAGEMRKLLIARALLKSPSLLILDEPFEGLDETARIRFRDFLSRLMQEKMQVILVTHHTDEIPEGITHAACLENGKLVRSGLRGEILNSRNFSASGKKERFRKIGFPCFPRTDRKAASEKAVPVIEMKGVTVRYGRTVVFKELHWTVRAGENWHITGPNGSGKTTLLSLIAGDHPQVYANDIRIFGRRRGTGETIWEIKSNIGLVSNELQVRYTKTMTAFEVILSGFFDSIGLYRRADAAQRAIAQEWMEKLDIAETGPLFFDRLSTGQQRMILIARAMVKSPRLLITDEPCQGLDQKNRSRVISLIDEIGKSPSTQLLYVTHRKREIPACISHSLCLGGNGDDHPDTGAAV